MVSETTGIEQAGTEPHGGDRATGTHAFDDLCPALGDDVTMKTLNYYFAFPSV